MSWGLGGRYLAGLARLIPPVSLALRAGMVARYGLQCLGVEVTNESRFVSKARAACSAGSIAQAVVALTRVTGKIDPDGKIRNEQ